MILHAVCGLVSLTQCVGMSLRTTYGRVKCGKGWLRCNLRTWQFVDVKSFDVDKWQVFQTFLVGKSRCFLVAVVLLIALKNNRIAALFVQTVRTLCQSLIQVRDYEACVTSYVVEIHSNWMI